MMAKPVSIKGAQPHDQTHLPCGQLLRDACVEFMHTLGFFLSSSHEITRGRFSMPSHPACAEMLRNSAHGQTPIAQMTLPLQPISFASVERAVQDSSRQCGREAEGGQAGNRRGQVPDRSQGCLAASSRQPRSRCPASPSTYRLRARSGVEATGSASRQVACHTRARAMGVLSRSSAELGDVRQDRTVL